MTRKNLITYIKPKSPISEAYRMLRTNISYSSYDKEIKSMVITSSGPGEGKTTTISNLAITMTQSGKKVILIDADLRKPRVHKHFNIINTSGVTNVIVENENYKNVIQELEDIKGLSILTSGPIPPNPSELLGSQKMKKFIESIREEYDIILIDAPPVGTVTDAAILSTIVDGTILVISSGTTTIEGAKRAKELLEHVKANILGVVVNKIQKSTTGSYYYYYYYSSYYEDETQGRKKKRKRKKEDKKG